MTYAIAVLIGCVVAGVVIYVDLLMVDRRQAAFGVRFANPTYDGGCDDPGERLAESHDAPLEGAPVAGHLSVRLVREDRRQDLRLPRSASRVADQSVSNPASEPEGQ